jgi:hypothetical protein
MAERGRYRKEEREDGVNGPIFIMEPKPSYATQQERHEIAGRRQRSPVPADPRLTSPRHTSFPETKPVATKITGKGTSSTRASLKSKQTCGFQPLRFALETWTTHLPARNLFRDVLDAPPPKIVRSRKLRAPSPANASSAPPRRPLQIARLRNHARACSSPAHPCTGHNHRARDPINQGRILA